MRRFSIVLFALLASVLAVSATPVSAADAGLELASRNTTSSDFNDATTLEGFEVKSSGDGELVAASGISTSVPDSFEDGDIAEYGGSTSYASVISNSTFDGSKVLNMESDGSHQTISSTDTGSAPVRGTTWRVGYYAVGSGNRGSFLWATSQEDASPTGYALSVRWPDDKIQLIRTDGDTSPWTNGEVLDEANLELSGYTDEKLTAVIS
ncbi:hypothetical protein E6P09_09570 [Haloferax mediterranei ATCC 33500]|uniref:Uncharacterized protein n=1 Tax=Haloferax mediterranei (strain ATCC 33500 / DSM 1411 / JCM 8866 / NBRC 14739 / NCIMB 2177 / R-4) TaxID=523841 RepID=I3R463_HALMT|nr:hypothetical protein [Haloferax mediterranei]AFK19023.1 hypothetical protein HFX_1312 [Haloferax mediterranei ATCC 33500]AHZ21617.1 hypothetical protein BM92_02625 [Haloferax mediterranei ATCC 33500]EMA03534.1 hypothetical protein C439_03945 [Haloferax mediterranei ATCC 33500]MDX5989117.1 hypothetical protein [Haloferax mediterranei ATCC 33500]QCQ75500.1 hypothetical protein E6P09_09570 [Haloferax mediterranei ATCC 33500]